MNNVLLNRRREMGIKIFNYVYLPSVYVPTNSYCKMPILSNMTTYNEIGFYIEFEKLYTNSFCFGNSNFGIQIINNSEFFVWSNDLYKINVSTPIGSYVKISYNFIQDRLTSIVNDVTTIDKTDSKFHPYIGTQYTNLFVYRNSNNTIIGQQGDIRVHIIRTRYINNYYDFKPAKRISDDEYGFYCAELDMFLSSLTSTKFTA